MEIMIGVIEQGMIYAIMAIGVYITYRILNFPDLTVDGSFPLGAAVTVMLMTKTDSIVTNPYMIMLIAFLAGAVSGLVTGIIHVKLKIRDLLSGVITMTALYSINLHIAGRANVPIFNLDTIFDNVGLNNIYPSSMNRYKVLIIVCLITLITKFCLDLYLKSSSGYLLRAVGDNPSFVTSLGKNSGNIKIIGLSLANGLVAFSGSIMMQSQGFFEISMGTGAMVIGLASVIIGTNIFKKNTSLKSTTAVIVGSIIYKACLSIAMDISLAMISSIVVLVLCIIFISKKTSIKIATTFMFTIGTYFIVKVLLPYNMSAIDMKLVTSFLFLIILMAGKKPIKNKGKVFAN